MLTIEPPLYQIRGVPIFRDDVDPDQFYYLPTTPHLARNGTDLAFILYKYRRDLTDNPALDPTRARGAGLALFDVDLAQAGLLTLQSELSSQSGREHARLDPVLFRSGTVRGIVAHGSGDQLIEDVSLNRNAPITTPHRSTFALALTAEGATFLEQAVKGGALPVGVAYELKFLASTPALHARVTMDYERMYDRFAASVGFTYYVRVAIDVDIAWLIEHEFIKVEITAFTDGEDQRRQQDLVMGLIRARVQGDFFRSTLPPNPTDAGTGGELARMLGKLMGQEGGTEISSASAIFTLKLKAEVVRETKSFVMIFNGRTAVELTHVATGFLATMVRPDDVPKVLEIDLDDPFFSRLAVDVTSVIDFDAMPDLTECAIDIRHGTNHKGIALKKGDAVSTLFEQALSRPGDDEYEYAVEYHFDPDRGAGPTTITVPAHTSRGRVLVIDPLVHMHYLRTRLTLGPIDATLVPRMHVRLKVVSDVDPPIAPQVVTLDPQHDELLWTVRLPIDAAAPQVFARVTWEDPHGSAHDLDPVPIVGDSLLVLGPYRGTAAIVVQPSLDWTGTTQLIVEIQYADGDYQVDRLLTFLPDQKLAAQRVEFALIDPQKRAYRWHGTFFKADGTTAETPPVETDRGLIVVTMPHAAGTDVRIMWVGAPGAAAGLRVDFWTMLPSGEEQNVAVFLRAGTDTQATATLPADGNGALHYRYEVHRIGATGAELLRSGQETTTLLVVST